LKAVGEGWIGVRYNTMPRIIGLKSASGTRDV
jgi:hypothetical protein